MAGSNAPAGPASRAAPVIAASAAAASESRHGNRRANDKQSGRRSRTTTCTRGRRTEASARTASLRPALWSLLLLFASSPLADAACESAVTNVMFEDTDPAPKKIHGKVTWTLRPGVANVSTYKVYTTFDEKGAFGSMLWDLMGPNGVPAGSTESNLFPGQERLTTLKGTHPANFLQVRATFVGGEEEKPECAATIRLFDESGSKPARVPFDHLSFVDMDQNSELIGGKASWTIAMLADLGYTTEWAVYVAYSADGFCSVFLGTVPIGTNEMTIPMGTDTGSKNYLLVYAQNSHGRADVSSLSRRFHPDPATPVTFCGTTTSTTTSTSTTSTTTTSTTTSSTTSATTTTTTSSTSTSQTTTTTSTTSSTSTTTSTTATTVTTVTTHTTATTTTSTTTTTTATTTTTSSTTTSTTTTSLYSTGTVIKLSSSKDVVVVIGLDEDGGLRVRFPNGTIVTVPTTDTQSVDPSSLPQTRLKPGALITVRYSGEWAQLLEETEDGRLKVRFLGGREAIVNRASVVVENIEMGGLVIAPPNASVGKVVDVTEAGKLVVNQSDGTIVVVHPRHVKRAPLQVGTLIKVADGSLAKVTGVDANGSVIVETAGGGNLTLHPDAVDVADLQAGTSIAVDPDGRRGTVVNLTSDGNMIVRFWDGSTRPVNLSSIRQSKVQRGDLVKVPPSNKVGEVLGLDGVGDVMVEFPDGTRTTADPDAVGVTHLSVGGLVPLPSGTVGRVAGVNADGAVRIALPDGSLIFAKPAGVVGASGGDAVAAVGEEPVALLVLPSGEVTAAEASAMSRALRRFPVDTLVHVGPDGEAGFGRVTGCTADGRLRVLHTNGKTKAYDLASLSAADLQIGMLVDVPPGQSLGTVVNSGGDDQVIVKLLSGGNVTVPIEDAQRLWLQIGFFVTVPPDTDLLKVAQVLPEGIIVVEDPTGTAKTYELQDLRASHLQVGTLVLVDGPNGTDLLAEILSLNSQGELVFRYPNGTIAARDPRELNKAAIQLGKDVETFVPKRNSSSNQSNASNMTDVVVGQVVGVTNLGNILVRYPNGLEVGFRPSDVVPVLEPTTTTTTSSTTTTTTNTTTATTTTTTTTTEFVPVTALTNAGENSASGTALAIGLILLVIIIATVLAVSLIWRRRKRADRMRTPLVDDAPAKKTEEEEPEDRPLPVVARAAGAAAARSIIAEGGSAAEAAQAAAAAAGAAGGSRVDIAKAAGRAAAMAAREKANAKAMSCRQDGTEKLPIETADLSDEESMASIAARHALEAVLAIGGSQDEAATLAAEVAAEVTSEASQEAGTEKVARDTIAVVAKAAADAAARAALAAGFSPKHVAKAAAEAAKAAGGAPGDVAKAAAIAAGIAVAAVGCAPEIAAEAASEAVTEVGGTPAQAARAAGDAAAEVASRAGSTPLYSHRREEAVRSASLLYGAANIPKAQDALLDLLKEHENEARVAKELWLTIANDSEEEDAGADVSDDQADEDEVESEPDVADDDEDAMERGTMSLGLDEKYAHEPEALAPTYLEERLQPQTDALAIPEKPLKPEAVMAAAWEHWERTSKERGFSNVAIRDADAAADGASDSGDESSSVASVASFAPRRASARLAAAAAAGATESAPAIDDDNDDEEGGGPVRCAPAPAAASALPPSNHGMVEYGTSARPF
eukprot:TRINITY_DN1737_c0_g1_i1.p1 TRINITY_DN1737_c0_g1~~TRINITY_DN1737_c0_g1_i1.p1  ORF type:complete len:1798 (+),score=296.35 TRINITY_DN1737_c0_g1_i1:444-5396(+)